MNDTVSVEQAWEGGNRVTGESGDKGPWGSQRSTWLKFCDQQQQEARIRHQRCWAS